MGEPQLTHPNVGKSYEEYLQIEENSELRNEYVYGEIFAMAGSSMNHNRISMNIAFELHRRLKHGKCRTYMSDMRLQIQFEAIYFYPDVLVTCSENDLTNGKSVSNPILLVEVLSASTANKDLNDKLRHYLQIPSLQYYLIISQTEISVLLYERTSLGWGFRFFTDENELIDLPLIGLNISVKDLFEGVIWEENEEKAQSDFVEEQ